MKQENRNDFDYILESIYDGEYETEEELKAALQEAQTRQNRLLEVQKLVEDIENQKRIYVPLKEEKNEDEVFIVGEVQARKTKVMDLENCKANFASFREKSRIKSAQNHLTKLENRFPLTFYENAGIEINTGERQLTKLKKALDKGFPTNKKLQQEMQEKYDGWKLVLKAYSDIYVNDFEEAEVSIEKIKDERIKESLTNYLKKEQQHLKELKANEKVEEKDTAAGYSFAKTVEEAKSQYGFFRMRNQFGYTNGVESVTRGAFGMLRASINNGEPDEVIEYRVARAEELLNKFLKIASKENYKIFRNRLDEIESMITNETHKTKKEEEVKEDTKKEVEEETPLVVNFDASAQSVMNKLRQNASFSNANGYLDCTNEIKALQIFLDMNFAENKETEKVKSAKLHLERLQEINDFQKTLYSFISTFSKPNAVMNPTFWNTEKENYQKLVEEINACFTEEGTNEWVGVLITECDKQIRINEENFIRFRENGGTTPDEMSDSEKGKKVRESLEAMCSKYIEFAKNGDFTSAYKHLNLIEKQYNSLSNDKNIFPNGETLNDLLGFYTRENVKDFENTLQNLDRSGRKIEFFMKALSQKQNSGLVQGLESQIQLLENALKTVKTNYEKFYNADFSVTEHLLENAKSIIVGYTGQTLLQNEKVRDAYYKRKKNNAKENVHKIEKKLEKLIASNASKEEILPLKIDLKENYTTLYMAREQEVKAGILRDQELYETANLAFKGNNLDTLNDIVDSLLEKRTELQEELVNVQKEIEKANDVCESYGLGIRIQTDIVELLDERLKSVKENAENYAVKSNEIATKQENEKLEEELNATLNSSERKEKEEFYQEMAKMSDDELKEAGIKGTEERKKKENAGELQPITVSKMPDLRQDEVKEGAFNQRVSQMEAILKEGPTMPIDELEEKLVTEKFLVEQNKNLFTEEQLSYLEDLAYRGEMLLSEETLKKL